MIDDAGTDLCSANTYFMSSTILERRVTFGPEPLSILMESRTELGSVRFLKQRGVFSTADVVYNLSRYLPKYLAK